MASSMLRFSTKRLARSNCLTISTLMKARAGSLMEIRSQIRGSRHRTRVNTIYCCALARQTDRASAAQYGNSLLSLLINRGKLRPPLPKVGERQFFFFIRTTAFSAYNPLNVLMSEVVWGNSWIPDFLGDSSRFY